MKNTINLLSISAKPLTFWEKFYIWALSIGRYIIIIVELIVLLAFLYKFKVDHDLANLQSDIKANIDVYNSETNNINKITTYQEQMSAQSQAMNNQQVAAPILQHTVSLVPSSISLGSLDLVTNTSIQITGRINGTGTDQLTTIQQLATTFKNDPDYTNVILSNVTTDSTSKVTTFNLTMDLAQNNSSTEGQ